MQKLILFLFLCFPFSLMAQSSFGFQDDFSDGDFTQNPTWEVPMISDFVVNSNKVLQLNAQSAGNSQLMCNYKVDTSMIWEFLLRMEFSPSATNRAIIHLEQFFSTGSPTLGYALLIGEDGSDDRIRLITTTNNTLNKPLLSANSPVVVNSQVNVRVRIKRSKDRLWTIEADYNGGYNFMNEGGVQEVGQLGWSQDQSMKLTLFYTETRKDKFFFDDFKVRKDEPDNIAPKAVEAVPLDKNKVLVKFDEIVDSLSAKNLNNYTVDNGLGSPSAISYALSSVTLVFSQNLKDGTNYNLLINNILDLSNNQLDAQTLDFKTAVVPIVPNQYDIIINEIFADPTPQIALPKAEFIELFNRSNKTINLQSWTIKDASTTLYTLPSFDLLPQKYVIIYKRDPAIDFGKYGDTIALKSFFSLNTTGDEIYLFDPQKNTIDAVKYNLDTYQDENKKDGGWTLERINPNTPCLGAENWKASESDNGGTPGAKNAAFSQAIEQEALDLLFAFPENNTTIYLRFNRSVDISSLQNIEISGLKIKEIKAGITLNEVKIIVENAMQSGNIYTLNLTEKSKDCVGNSANKATFELALPEIPDSRDIVINEILFNPKTGGVDFIELYNRSNKAINLKGLILENQTVNNSKESIENDFLLLPKSYAVLTESPSNIKLNYEVKSPKQLIINELPSMADDKGNVTLYRPDAPNKRLIDAVTYHEDWHYGLLQTQSGVSLERLDPERPSMDSSNWYSAASIVGFATPTYQNSQYSIFSKNEKQYFTLDNQRISPDNDGFEDFIQLQYQAPTSLNATITIYDWNGVLVKNIVEQETLATEGIIRWDGDLNDGSRAKMGIYVMLITYFDENGKVGKEKKTITVLYRF
jgi:hypothetical protein